MLMPDVFYASSNTVSDCDCECSAPSRVVTLFKLQSQQGPDIMDALKVSQFRFTPLKDSRSGGLSYMDSYLTAASCTLPSKVGTSSVSSILMPDNEFAQLRTDCTVMFAGLVGL